MRRGTKSHRILKDRAMNRVDDLQCMFMDLQSARKEKRKIDMVVLEEQVHQMLKEWKKELNEPSFPASSFQQGGSLGSFSPDITRLLHLYDEEDDATSGLPVPKPDPDAHNDTEITAFHKNFVVTPVSQEQGFKLLDQYKDSPLGINTTAVHNMGVDYFSFDLPHEFENNCIGGVYDMYGEDGLPQITNFLPNICPPPSAFFGPKCALWDCPRPAQGWWSETPVQWWCTNYCSNLHGVIAQNEGQPGMIPILRPKGIELKDNLLFAALSAKGQGKNVGIPECEGAATAKSPWNAPDTQSPFLPWNPSMADDAKDIEKLYVYGERLSEAKDKSQNVEDYKSIIEAARSPSVKARQLAAQLIPRFFKFFPDLSGSAVDAQIDLCEAEELGIRVQAIRGLPLFCKDTPEHLSKIVDILAQLLIAEENVERDAVHKALLSLLRQDVKASLTALFKHIESVDEPVTDDNLRERTLIFIRDKVFPLKSELLKPQEQMERHITDLIKKSLQDVTGAEFKMFMDFLKSLSIFGDKAPSEHVQELVEIIEGQADLDAQFSVEDGDHVDRLISCIYMALPFFIRGASSGKFLNYLNKHILPIFDKLPEERKIDLLKNLAESSSYAAPQDSRQILPSVVQLLKKYMPLRKTGEEMNFTYVECLLYTFHHLANKAPNATNSLCGYKIVTGQPSDRLGEDFTEFNKDFTERLTCVEDLTKAAMKKLTQGMGQQNKTTGLSDEEKAKIKIQKQNATTGLRTCNNILAMTQPLHSKAPSFIGDKRINLSWNEAVKVKTVVPANAAGGKRPANNLNGSDNQQTNKRGRGGGNQLVDRAFESISYGGGRRGSRGGGGGGQGRRRGGGYYR